MIVSWFARMNQRERMLTLGCRRGSVPADQSRALERAPRDERGSAQGLGGAKRRPERAAGLSQRIKNLEGAGRLAAKEPADADQSGGGFVAPHLSSRRSPANTKCRLTIRRSARSRNRRLISRSPPLSKPKAAGSRWFIFSMMCNGRKRFIVFENVNLMVDSADPTVMRGPVQDREMVQACRSEIMN